MARLMALDVGKARIGVAVSDTGGFLASPYTTLRVPQDEQQLWTQLQRLIEETGAEGLVIGLPISLDGQLHAQAAWVQDFTERLRQHIALPITFWDERLSTVEAQRLLMQRDQELEGRRRGSAQRRQARGKKKRGAQEIDALAAVVFLQEYLDHLRSQGRQ